MTDLIEAPTFRKTRVKWIGDIPPHWQVSQIKWLSPVRRGASPRPIDDPTYFDDNGEWAWVRIADVSSAGSHLTATTQRLSALGRSRSVGLLPGSLFVSIAGSVGKACITDIKACIHDGFVYFPALSMNPDYLLRIFESGRCFEGLGKMGTQLNLNTDTIGSIHVPLPPPDEQQAIASWIASETTQIDYLIDKQQRLIELFNEKRQAIINRAVTVGLDPTAPSRPSRTPWLDGAPAHWTKIKLCWAFSFLNGDRGSNYPSPDDFQGHGVPFINAGHLNDGGVDMTSMNFISRAKYEELGGAKLRAGDVLYCLRGSLGKHALIADLEEGALASSLVALRPIHPALVSPAYLMLLLKSSTAETQLAVIASGSAQPNLSVENLRSFSFQVPPLEEQKWILDHVNRECDRLNKIQSTARTMIAALRERRFALINDAVTGKIDVQGQGASA
jgi:type I restriction enzyme S subunit